jgi:Fur family transcriptional regulator, ferric uptake regulator
MAHPQATTPERAAFVERFRRLRLRVTSQRLLVMEALATHGGHMTADEILQWAAKQSSAINLATIYRTLDALAAVGLVTQTDLGGGATQFELVSDSHHHLVCERCGGVIAVDDSLLAPLRERLLEQLGFRASSRHMAIFGTCRACLGAETAADRSSHASSPAPVARE